MAITPTPQRQLDIGPASWFRPEPVVPAANQVLVKAGFLYAGSHEIFDQYTGGDQLTAGFAVVGAGFKRWDLVYLDQGGAVQILQGTAVASATPAYQGAPGWNSGGIPGPNLPNPCIPVAWILIDETATVVVDVADITHLTGFLNVTNDNMGMLVDKGTYGASALPAPSGSSDTVTAMFTGEQSGGGTSALGVVTGSPLNYVHMLDQNRDQLIHAATGSRVYGRITEAASVWTINYYYTDASGAEQPVSDISTDCTVTPSTGTSLAGVPKVYSKNDPTRPLFNSDVVRISDQIAGDIPYATTTVPGKVEFALTDGSEEATPSLATQNDDVRLGRAKAAERAATSGVLLGVGTPSGFRREVAFVQGANMTINVYDDSANDRVVVELIGGAFPGYYTLAPPANDGTGSAGASALVSRGNHYHPGVQVTYQFFSSSAAPSLTMSGKTPQLAIALGSAVGFGTISIGLAAGTGSSNQMAVRTTETVGEDYGQQFIRFSGTQYWTCTTFSSTSVSTTRTGTSTVNAFIAALS